MNDEDPEAHETVAGARHRGDPKGTGTDEEVGMAFGFVWITKPISNHKTGLWFWRFADTQCCSHRTLITPNWCEIHRQASDGQCIVCQLEL